MADWQSLDQDVQEQIRSLEQLRARLASAGGEQKTVTPPDTTTVMTPDDLEGAFLELLSHEIRTPLTSTIGYLDLMLAGDAGEMRGEQRHCVIVARRSASRVLALVTDLVVIARSEAGWLRFAPQPVDLALIVSNAALAAAASTSEVAVVTHAPIAVDVPGDPEALRHVMSSLITRAVRSARPGGRVDVTVRQQGSHAVAEITHTGRPLPEPEGSALHAIMNREPRAVADAVDGAGIELASAKAVLGAHGGRLIGSDDSFDGTRVAVELPLAGESSAHEMGVAESAPSQ